MKEITSVPVRLKAKDHEMLRKLSYLTEQSMNRIIVTAIRKAIEDHKKILQNADVVIS